MQKYGNDYYSAIDVCFGKKKRVRLNVARINEKQDINMENKITCKCCKKSISKANKLRHILIMRKNGT
jgi:hypothetical protein